MTSDERRRAILSLLSQTKQNLSASALAAQFSVSRQVIVGDIALLRAAGNDISATPRGYVIAREKVGITRRLACFHAADGTREELNIMVDCGCTVLDVIVEHPVYGQLTAPLQIASRYDVEQFMEKMKNCDAQPLSLLTEGVHLHTVQCPNETVFAHLEQQLARRGFLLTEST
jgi:transcriptional regulator of NAD metabolism